MLRTKRILQVSTNLITSRIVMSVKNVLSTCARQRRANLSFCPDLVRGIFVILLSREDINNLTAQINVGENVLVRRCENNSRNRVHR
jgi:hypothetical protein